jgi:hypothetical protein
MTSTSKIEISLEGVGRILINCNVSVPIYQRSYAWEDEHVTDLFNDIATAMKAGAPEYFIGSIVTTNNQAARVEIADGQQRLATITILLAAIRDYFYEKGDRGHADLITSDYLHKRELKTLTPIPKMKLNDIDNNYFAGRVLLPPDSPKREESPANKSHFRIDNAAALAKKHIKYIAAAPNATDKLVDLVTYLSDSVKVIWVRVPDDTNAFMIFETLNDRGLSLAITDLLKNHLFGLSGARLSEVQMAWISTVSVLEGADEENILLTFLRHYWSSRFGLVREKELYADIKKRVSNLSLAVDFAKELEQNAQIYVAIVNTAEAFWSKYGDTCRKHMEMLNILRMIQIRPLILSVLSTFKEAEAKIAIKNMLSWSVRFLIHGGLGTGAIETNYSQAAKAIREGKITTAAKLFGYLKSVIPTDAKFRTALLSASVSKAFLARYYLRALEQQEGDLPGAELVPNDNSEVINLEHILPQNPSSIWSHFPEEEQTLLFDKLGNLALMTTRINAKAGNDGFAFKKKLYAKSEFRLTQSLAKYSRWDRRSIEDRQAHLADLALKAWPIR